MIHTRLADKEDHSFVLSSYYHCLRNSPSYSIVTNDVCSSHLNPKINTNVENNTVLIAYDDSEPSVILGYIIFNQNQIMSLIHMIYVKKIYRGMGVAKKLFERIEPTLPIVYTCQTAAGKAVIKKLTTSPCFFNPFVL